MSLGDLSQEDFKSGFIALIGRPNVGKSTFINKFIGEKIAITSPIAQTTRNRLKVILTNEKSQIIFVDTPGIHKPHHLLGERLVQSAKRSIGDVDAVLVIFEASHSPGRGDAFILNLIRNLKIPVIVALNKWDLLALSQFKERKKEYLEFLEGTNWPVFCCSALTGQGCDELISEIEFNTVKDTVERTYRLFKEIVESSTVRLFPTDVAVPVTLPTKFILLVAESNFIPPLPSISPS